MTNLFQVAFNYIFFLVAGVGFYYKIFELSHDLFTHLDKNTKIFNLKAASRVVASLHSMLIASLSALYLVDMIPYDYWKYVVPTTTYYLVYDSLLLIVYPEIKDDTGSMIYGHHGLFLIGMNMFCEKQYSYLFARLLIGEFSNFPLYLSWYLNQATNFHTLTTVSFVTSVFLYFFLRIVNYSTVLLKLQFVQLVLFLPILSMNYMWFAGILTIASKYLL